MADAHISPDPSELVVEAEAKQHIAEKLASEASVTPPDSPEWAAAADADDDATEEWDAASAITSKLEGFTGGEAAE
jgi:hypothetical protein